MDLEPGGKLENLKTETKKNKISILGVSEVRWRGQGEIRSSDPTVYCNVHWKCTFWITWKHS